MNTHYNLSPSNVSKTKCTKQMVSSISDAPLFSVTVTIYWRYLSGHKPLDFKYADVLWTGSWHHSFCQFSYINSRTKFFQSGCELYSRNWQKKHKRMPNKYVFSRLLWQIVLLLLSYHPCTQKIKNLSIMSLFLCLTHFAI